MPHFIARLAVVQHSAFARDSWRSRGGDGSVAVTPRPRGGSAAAGGTLSVISFVPMSPLQAAAPRPREPRGGAERIGEKSHRPGLGQAFRWQQSPHSLRPGGF